MIFNQIQVLKETKPSWLYLLLLILSGEAIFILPFVFPRVFRPTIKKTKGFSLRVGASPNSCGYVGYKITDIISQYAEEVMLYNHGLHKGFVRQWIDAPKWVKSD